MFSTASLDSGSDSFYYVQPAIVYNDNFSQFLFAMGRIGAEYKVLSKKPTLLPEVSGRSVYDKTDFQGTFFFRKINDTFYCFLLNETGYLPLIEQKPDGLFYYNENGVLAINIIMFFNNLKILPEYCCFVVVFDTPKRALFPKLTAHRDSLSTSYMPEGFIGSEVSDYTTIITNDDDTPMTVIVTNSDEGNISLPANKNTFVTINNRVLQHSSPPTDSPGVFGELLKRIQLLFIDYRTFEEKWRVMERQNNNLLVCNFKLSPEHGVEGFKKPGEIPEISFTQWKGTYRYPLFIEAASAYEFGGGAKKKRMKIKTRSKKLNFNNKSKRSKRSKRSRTSKRLV